MEFEIEKIKTDESFSENGIIFLEVLIEHIKILSDAKGVERINSFYSELARSAYVYAKNTLLSESKSEYEHSEDSRKRFSFRPYSYRFCCDVSGCNEKYISIICKLFLARKGKVLHEDRLGHIWSRSGELVPLRVILGKEYKNVKKRLANEAKKRNLSEINRHSFALKNGSIVFFAKKAQDGRQRVTEISCSAPEENKEKVKENY